MNSTGMNTAASESVIDTMVKPTSRAPSSVACIGVLPISRWRLMFSSMTMASSTTKPTHSVNAISDRLSRLKPIRCMIEKVPTMDIGSDRLGISVADRLRRNRKITSTTRARASTSVNFTSSTDSRIDNERSYMTLMLIPGGTCSRKAGSSFLTASTTSMVLVPG